MRTNFINLSLLLMVVVAAPTITRAQLQPIATRELRIGFVSPTTNYISLQAPAVTTNYTLLLPPTTGTSGQTLITNGSGTLSWSTALTPTTGWSTTGNSGTNATNNFLGTTDARALVFRTSNIERASITSAGVFTTESDATLNGLTVGRGGGSLATNVAIGGLGANTTGANNVAIGPGALSKNTTGSNNIAIGDNASRDALTATGNVAIGATAMLTNNGSDNVAIGRIAGRYSDADGEMSSTSNSVFLGTNTRAAANSQTNQIVIGYNAIGLGSNTVVLGNSSIVTTALRGNVLINNSGSNNPGAVRFLEGSTGGTNYIGLRAPATLGTDFTYTLPSTAPTAGQVLSSAADGTLSWSSITGLQLFEETLHTAAPNNIVNALSWRPKTTTGTTNVDVVLSPKGIGALQAQVADGTATGGNKRGPYAVDWQLSRSSTSQVASGASSVISGGTSNTTSGSGSVVGGGSSNIVSGTLSVIGGGTSNTASGNYATIGGGSGNTASDGYATIGGGSGNTSSGLYSVVVGGTSNVASGLYSAVLGGQGLTLSGSSSAGINGSSSPMSVSAANTFVLGNVNLWLANNDNTARELRFYEAQNTTGAFPATNINYTAFKAGAQSADITYTLPTAAPTANGQVLTSTTGGEMSWSTLTGLQLFEETLHTASPNNTVNALSWKPKSTTGTTNVDVVLSPKGAGALLAQVPDGTTAGGNKRGPYAVDWQRQRGLITEVASGGFSVIGGGGNNTASGAYAALVGGYNNYATGDWSFVGSGTDVSAGGDYSVAVGGSLNMANGDFSAILGGNENIATGMYSSILGGYGLTLSGNNSAGFNGSSSAMSVSAPNTFVLGNVNLWLANNDNTARELRFYEAQNTTGAFPATNINYTAFKAGAQSADITYTLPTAAPTTNGQVLSSTTGGEMSWETAATLSSTGTTNRLSKFTSATGLGDSRISDDGTDITVGVGQTAGAINIGSALTTGTVSIGGTSQTGLVAVGNGTSATQQIIEIGRYGNKAIQIGSESNANNEINIISRKATTFYGPEIAFRANTSGTTTAPELRLHEDYPGVGITPEHIGLKAPAVLSASQVYTLPANAPTVNGQVLSSTTAGVMSWQTGLTATSGWTTAGNAGTTASNYLGTSDAQPLSIRTGGVQRIGVDADGTVRVTGTTNLGPLNVSGETYFPSSNAVIFSGSGAKLFSSGDVSFSTSGAINFSGGGAKTFNNGSVDFNLGSDLQFRGNGNKTFSLGNIIFSTTGSMTVSGPLLDITSAGGLRVASNSVAQVLSRMGVGLAPTSNTGDAQLQVTAAASANRGLTITGAASQTANLLELRNSAGTALLSADNNGTLTLNPFGASAGNTNELRFAELAVNGTNYVGFKAADNITSNLVYTLPTTAPTAGQVLSSAADGTMSWVTPSTGWSLTGNAGTSPSATLGNTAVGNFIGTTDGVSLSFVTSNIVRMRIDANGNPFTQLDMSINGVMVGKGGGSISRNVRVGSGALNATATGNDNTAVGNNALNANVGGQDNSALGESALESNTGGNANTAVGQDALRANTTGGSNVAIGASSLDASNNSFNVAVGHSALGAQNGGDGNNTAVGAAAMMFNLTGAYNAAFGLNAFRELTSGNNNVAIGHAAGMLLAGNTGNLTTATNSIFIGNGTKANANGETNQIVIGTGAEGIGSNTVVLGSSTILTTALRGNVGIGTTAPAGTLHAVNTSATTNAVVDVARLDVQSSGTPAVGIGTGLEFATETAANNTEVGAIIEAVTTDVTATTEDFDLVFKTMAGGAAAAERMRIESNGDVTATAFFETSDARLKEVIRRDGNVVYFKWKDRRDDRIHIGYLAQEVQETHPDQVNTDANGVMSVHYIELLIEKIRQLEKRIEDLESQKK